MSEGAATIYGYIPYIDRYLLAGYAIEITRFAAGRYVRIEIRPAFDKVERILRTFLIEIFETTGFLREFIRYLPYVNSLQSTKNVINGKSVGRVMSIRTSSSGSE